MDNVWVGYEGLATAIVQQAAADYLHVRKEMDEYDKSDGYYIKKLRGEYDALIRFFHSDWYSLLCQIDGDWLISELDERYETRVRKQKERARWRQRGGSRDRRNIDVDKLKAGMKAKNLNVTRIEKLGVYSHKTITKGLEAGSMSIDLIAYLANLLKIPAKEFADVSFKYTARMRK